MGEVIQLPSQLYINTLVLRLRQAFEEAAAEWKAHGASVRYHDLRNDADRAVTALICAGLSKQAVLLRTLRREGECA